MNCSRMSIYSEQRYQLPGTLIIYTEINFSSHHCWYWRSRRRKCYSYIIQRYSTIWLVSLYLGLVCFTLGFVVFEHFNIFGNHTRSTCIRPSLVHKTIPGHLCGK